MRERNLDTISGCYTGPGAETPTQTQMTWLQAKTPKSNSNRSRLTNSICKRGRSTPLQSQAVIPSWLKLIQGAGTEKNQPIWSLSDV
ncbi:hypothetical protein HanIR_Chr15g0732081 [Helianthus annuus]|nr:hypothetical protein HanIR_Chr15g0732081 [Helianthus annuus]